VTDPTTRPAKLGPEIGRAENRHTRHRLFAVVDRTNLTVFRTASKTAVFLPPGQTTVTAVVKPAQMSGVSGNGMPWQIQPGSIVTLDAGTREETVVVTAVTPTTFTATFTQSHPVGVVVFSRGNPGPWPGFNPRANAAVVPFFSVIQ